MTLASGHGSTFRGLFLGFRDGQREGVEEEENDEEERNMILVELIDQLCHSCENNFCKVVTCWMVK